MNSNFLKIVEYLVLQGAKTLREKTVIKDFAVDFVNIFCRCKQEYDEFLNEIDHFATNIQTSTEGTGKTFQLKISHETPFGKLNIIRIRKPDPSRPQRGGIDFKVENYESFKSYCFSLNSGDFSLVMRTDFELIEIKGDDVLVYIPNFLLSESLH